MSFERTEGKGGADISMNPAALDHDHHKAHHIGKAFSSAHGHSHHGMEVPASAGPQPGPENESGAPEFASE